MTATVPDWMDREYGIAADALLRCVSAVDLACERRGFGQRIVPAKGSVLAARQVAFYDPDPDYFFHWLRDSALIMDAVRILLNDRRRSGEVAAKFGDFLRFSLRLRELNGCELLRGNDFRRRVDPALLDYVRADSELQQIKGEHTLAEARFNPDGTPDIIRWPRPQNDGPALRALTVLRYRETEPARNPDVRALMGALLSGDLAYTARHRTTPSFDIWEEELGHSYYTRLVQRAALLEGAAWACEMGDRDGEMRYCEGARELATVLDAYWSADRGHYLSRTGVDGRDPNKLLDSATMLAVLHARLPSGPHSILDPGVQATWWQLENLFASAYPINRNAQPGFGPALGRYQGDVYYQGGPWYVVTLGFAELYFCLAAAIGSGAAIHATRDNVDFLDAIGGEQLSSLGPLRLDAAQRHRLFLGLLKKGDAIMATVQRYTPATGELSEQFDQNTGEQRSAKNLGWSYAAFVTAFTARKRACACAQALASSQ